MNSGDIREHMMVLARGSGETTGAQVGTVDEVEGNFIKLTKKDSPDGQHHWIPLSWIERVDEQAVYLSKTPDDFRQGAMTQNPDADVAGAAAFGAGAAAGIEQIGRPAAGRDADLFGNAPGSGGVTLGNLAAGTAAASDAALGDPGPGGTMDDGNGGTESPTGTGLSIGGDNGMAGVNPGGRGNMNPASQTGNLGGSMAPQSGEGEYLSAGAGPGLVSGGNSTTSGKLESGSLESISGDVNGGASANSGVGSAAASGHLAGGTGSSYGSLTGGATTNATENLQSGGARQAQESGATGAEFEDLPSAYGGTLDGQDPLTEDSALSSAGGSMLSNRDIGVTGAQSPMGDRNTTDLGGQNVGNGQLDRDIKGYEAENRAVGPGTDEYVAEKDASGDLGDTTSDRALMSGAGGASGDFDDRNAHTGASGNVSDPNGLPGQGTMDDASGQRGNE